MFFEHAFNNSFLKVLIMGDNISLQFTDNLLFAKCRHRHDLVMLWACWKTCRQDEHRRECYKIPSIYRTSNAPMSYNWCKKKFPLDVCIDQQNQHRENAMKFRKYQQLPNYKLTDTKNFAVMFALTRKINTERMLWNSKHLLNQIATFELTDAKISPESRAFHRLIQQLATQASIMIQSSGWLSSLWPIWVRIYIRIKHF